MSIIVPQKNSLIIFSDVILNSVINFQQNVPNYTFCGGKALASASSALGHKVKLVCLRSTLNQNRMSDPQNGSPGKRRAASLSNVFQAAL